MPSYLHSTLKQWADGAVVVTATRRLSRYCLQQFDQFQLQQGADAWPTPTALTWDEWIESEWRQLAGSDPRFGKITLLDDDQELLLWESVIERSIDRSRDQALLQVSATSRAARDAWRILHDWCIPFEKIGDPINEDTRVFLEWITDFRRLAGQRGWMCAAELPALLRRLLDEGTWQPRGKLIFAGFDHWPPARASLLENMVAAGVDVEKLRTPCVNKSKRVVSCSDLRQEFEAAASWARDLLNDGVTEPIGIVVEDLSEHRDQIEVVFDQMLHQGESIGQDDERKKAFHISIGRPLADYPVISTALVLLDFMSGVRPIQDATRLLHSPFISGGMRDSAAHARLDLELRRRGRQDVSLVDIRTCVESCDMQSLILDRNLARAGEYSWRGPRAPADWAASFVEWLSIFGWPGDRAPNSSEFQTIGAWRELLSRFARLNVVAPRMGVSAAAAAIRRMAKRRIFQGIAAPAPVQIRGVAESAGMQFGNLWISAMTDDAWPPASDPNPFIPYPLQRRFGSPGARAEEDLKRYEDLTQRLLDSAENAVISYSRSKGDQPLRLSGLFQSIAETPCTPYHAGLCERIRADLPVLEVVVDSTGPALDRKTLRGGAGLFKDQSACPFRAFARHRLAVADFPGPGPGLDAAERGNLIHDVLARVWREIGSGSRLAALSGGDIQAVLDRCIEPSVDRLKRRYNSMFISKILDMERARLKVLLATWLNVERERDDFNVVFVEHEIDASFRGLEMVLRVDRIDELDNGSWLIIDYKTSRSVTIKHWEGARPEEPQLPLYLLNIENAGHDVGGLAFAHLRTEANCFRGVVEEKSFADGVVVSDCWAETKERWGRVLSALADQFSNGAAAVDPRNPNVCNFCAVGPFCRIYDREAFSRAGYD